MREATEKEYQLVVSKYGRSQRKMPTKRTFDVIWSDGRGTEIAQKTEILSRGKVQKVHYRVNPDFLPGKQARLSRRVAGQWLASRLK